MDILLGCIGIGVGLGLLTVFYSIARLIYLMSSMYFLPPPNKTDDEMLEEFITAVNNPPSN